MLYMMHETEDNICICNQLLYKKRASINQIGFH